MRLLPLLVFCMGVQAAERPDWTRYVIFPEGADYEVESKGPDAFVIRARRTDGAVPKTGTLAIANIERDVWTHEHVAMSVRSLNGKRVDVGVTLSYPEGGKVVMKSGGGAQVAGSAWREINLALDQDFGLGDRSVRVKQAKIGAWIGHWKSGEEGGIEVRNFRLCPAAEAGSLGARRPGDEFFSVPSSAKAKTSPRADGLKVFFAFDNEDLEDSVSVRKKGLVDRQQFGGFRELMLRGAEGAARHVDKLEEAEVIVYSRCHRDDALAAGIAAAVKDRGVPLYVASEVCDPEVEALLPCVIGHEVPQDLPPRERIRAADPSHPLASRGGLSDAPFGIYRSIKLKDGARKVLEFANGTPAVVEGSAGKGRVVYSMPTIGSSLVPGMEAHDAFLLRVLGYLAARSLPERRRTETVPDAKGWWKGVGEGEFGRFGWETGSGMLVENIGTRFDVSCGEAAYEFDYPGDDDGKGRRFTFAGDRVNQLSLGGVLAVNDRPVARVDMSLGYPGTRWNFRCGRVALHCRNLLARAVVPTRGGPRVFDIGAGESIPSEGWTAPWVLLCNGSERDSPLLLVFQHRPHKVETRRSGLSVDSLVFSSRSGALGAITPTWIYGSQRVDTTGWTNRIDREVLARIAKWVPRSLRYPVDCREFFRLREDRGRIVVRADFSYIESADDWNTRPAVYAPVPPLVNALADAVPAAPGLMDSRMTGPVAMVPPSVVSAGLVTRYGDFADRPDSTSVQYALPLPVADLGFLPHSVGFADCERVANEQFASAVRFTCGGGVKVDYAKDKHGPGRAPGVLNCNMHGSLLGMCRCTQNPFIYSEENRRLMRRRMVWRMLEPLETMQYRMVCRWRREPVSGTEYAIYMNSPRDISTRYLPEEYGSKIIYGDSNETVRMQLFAMQVLEDRWGQHGLARANWDTVRRHIASYHLHIDDWAIHASGCLEFGGPGSIDMLNSEYACMMTLSRLAELAGDEAMRVQALYRASRRLCPTLARLKMLGYYARTAQLDNPTSRRCSTGFSEHGASFQQRGSRVQDIDLFDMSQGIPQDLVRLYDWFGWKDLRADYIADVAAADGAKGLDYITLAALAIGGDVDAIGLRGRMDSCLANEKLNARLPRDWPGMDTGSYMEYTLARLAGAPHIADCRSTYVHDASWDASTGVLSLDYTPGPGARLVVVSPAGERRELPVTGTERRRHTVGFSKQ